MLVPKFTKIVREEMPDAPNWIVKMITPINLFIQQTWSCLQNLTFGQNIIGKFVILSITTPADYASGGFSDTTFQWDFKKGVEGITIQRVKQNTANPIIITDAVTITGWEQTAGGIKINYITGLQPSTRYFITILAL